MGVLLSAGETHEAKQVNTTGGPGLGHDLNEPAVKKQFETIREPYIETESQVISRDY